MLTQARSPRSLSALLDGPVPVLVLVVAGAVAGAAAGGLTDLHVYQHAAGLVLDGESLARTRDPVTGLPFTYPPFAALVLAPLAWVPFGVAAASWTAGSTAALAAVVALALRALDRPAPGWLVALLALGAVGLEPVWQNLTFGQVNLLLLLAVLTDVLRPERRWAGVLLGVAAGVKLTPLVFVVLLVLVGRRPAAARALVVFATTVVVGFVVAPASASAYWGDRLLDAARVGPPGLAHNQSAYGALTRLLGSEPSTLLWLAVAAPFALATLAVASHWWLRGDRLLGAGLAALAMLVASPIAWSHHWVWAVPIGLALWQRSRAACVVWTAVFATRPFVWLPYGDGREYAWSWLEHVAGNAYLLAAVGVVIWATRQAAGAASRAGPPGIIVGGQSHASPHGR